MKRKFSRPEKIFIAVMAPLVVWGAYAAVTAVGAPQTYAENNGGTGQVSSDTTVEAFSSSEVKDLTTP